MSLVAGSGPKPPALVAAVLDVIYRPRGSRDDRRVAETIGRRVSGLNPCGHGVSSLALAPRTLHGALGSVLHCERLSLVPVGEHLSGVLDADGGGVVQGRRSGVQRGGGLFERDRMVLPFG